MVFKKIVPLYCAYMCVMYVLPYMLFTVPFITKRSKVGTEERHMKPGVFSIHISN